MKINLFERLIGSGFYTGYFPIASGTFGSMVAFIIYWIPGFEAWYIILPSIIFVVFYGIKLGDKFEAIYGKDPAECTIDEVAGMWISLFLLPKTIVISIIAFFLWRIFDIIKPPPARNLEKIKGGVGIMLDDVASAFYVLGIMHLLAYFIKL